MKLILPIILFQSILALPRFAVQEGASCSLCHVNPTGGGLRNDYGSTVFALEELPMQTMQKFGSEDWDGYVGDFLQIGGDFRVQGFAYTKDDDQKTSFFPMQADLYTFLEINEKAGLYYKISLGQNNPEYWTLLSILPNDGWIRIGRTLPNFGLKLDDHTSFIRGGNLSRSKLLYSEKEGLIFNPWVDLPAIFEFGINPFDQLSLTASFSDGIVGNSEKIEDMNFTTNVNFLHSIFNTININTGISFMQESDFQLTGISGGVTLGNLTWKGEIDQSQNWPKGVTAFTSYSELVYKYTQGIHLLGKYDFYDPDKDLQSGAITRYTIGVELFPLNILEIKLQSRFSQIDLDEVVQPYPEFLIQFHTWF